MFFYSQNLHEITYTRASFSLGLSSVISKVSVVDFEHEYQTLLFESLKYFNPETNTYSKLATETRCEICYKSTLLTAFLYEQPVKCLRLLLSPFLLYYEHFFVYCDAFVFKITFWICLLSILNRFHALIYLFCYQP